MELTIISQLGKYWLTNKHPHEMPTRVFSVPFSTVDEAMSALQTLNGLPYEKLKEVQSVYRRMSLM